MNDFFVELCSKSFRYVATKLFFIINLKLLWKVMIYKLKPVPRQ